MKIINLWGGPSTSKTTTAAGLFFEMKKMQLKVELVTEYAKSLVYDRRFNILEDQIYVFAKQQRQIARLLDHGLEWVISDSPIPLGLCYTKPGSLSVNFDNLVMEVFNRYDNYNYLLSRNVEFSPIGRTQKTEEEAKEFDEKVKLLLNKFNMPYQNIIGGEPAVDTILTNIGLKGEKND